MFHIIIIIIIIKTFSLFDKDKHMQLFIIILLPFSKRSYYCSAIMMATSDDKNIDHNKNIDNNFGYLYFLV